MEEYNYILELIKEVFLDKEDSLSELITKLSVSSFSYYFNNESKNKKLDNSIYYWTATNGKLQGILGEFFVLSGSIQDDSLPMWSYYSKNDNYCGYSIKLNANKIANKFIGEVGEFLYGKIIYDKSTQIEIIENYVTDLSRRYPVEIYNDTQIDEMQNEFFDFIQKIRLFYKREGFSHEKEFRMVLLVDDERKGPDFLVGNDDKINKVRGFSVINGVIKPYIEYQWSDGVPIEQITMSPSIEEGLGRKGLEILIENYYKEGYDKINIQKSKLQLRY